MASRWEGFPFNAGKPAGYDGKITRLNHGEQKWKIAVDGCFKEVSSSMWVYEYFVLSETRSLMKDNFVLKPGEQELWLTANLEESKKKVGRRKIDFTANVNIVWWRKTFSYCIWWRISETAKMTKTAWVHTGIRLLHQLWVSSGLIRTAAQTWADNHGLLL